MTTYYGLHLLIAPPPLYHEDVVVHAPDAYTRAPSCDQINTKELSERQNSCVLVSQGQSGVSVALSARRQRLTALAKKTKRSRRDKPYAVLMSRRLLRRRRTANLARFAESMRHASRYMHFGAAAARCSLGTTVHSHRLVADHLLPRASHQRFTQSLELQTAKRPCLRCEDRVRTG